MTSHSALVVCISFLDFNHTTEARLEMALVLEKFMKEQVCFKAEIVICK